MTAVALVALAACAAYDSLQDLDAELGEAGFSDVTTSVEATDGSVVVVDAGAPRGRSAEEAQDQAAEVVWTTFPHRFDRLRVSIDDEAETWTYADLEDELGDRPASLDVGGDIVDELTRTTLIAVLGIVAAGIVGLALLGLVIATAMRASRRNAAARPRVPPRPWMPPGVAGGHPHSHQPPGGWTPAPPAEGWAPASAPPDPGPTPTPGSPVTLAKEPAGTGPAPPPPPVARPRRRPRDPDARRLGRRPRGPRPDPAHTPPGWG